ncbi:hypothetical protein EBBID32_33820 [Sphingobium indicum BiD32]|uniref:Uncharacterized protein n=1 Tax=Sphingobium indicum BiD32 TaxID=1301087 RepID=N1MUJ0_9SPHN|nr:hypothetical protein EBBID32_33820 [Sphingobium indicum BiD32]
MFDLKPGVHFHEPYPIRAQAFRSVGDEFDRACADIVHCLGGADGGGTDGFAGGGVHAGRGRFLDHLLVAALERAVALEQVDDIAMAVAKDLHLDMAWVGDPFFEQDMVIAEAGRGLALAGGERVGEIGGSIDLAHPLAAAARDRLDKDGVADGVGLGREMGGRLVRAEIARRGGNARILHQLLGRIFQAHGGDGGWIGTDPDEACVDDRLGEFRVFGQEAIAGVDRLRAGLLGGGDDAVTQQIGFAHWRRADMDGFVGGTDMERSCIGVRIDSDGADAHRACGADDTAGDFAAIGDEEGFKHRDLPIRHAELVSASIWRQARCCDGKATVRLYSE